MGWRIRALHFSHGKLVQQCSTLADFFDWRALLEHFTGRNIVALRQKNDMDERAAKSGCQRLETQMEIS